ncbi:MAG: hypothetical protein OHK0045_18760 [Raineya sp.]
MEYQDEPTLTLKEYTQETLDFIQEKPQKQNIIELETSKITKVVRTPKQKNIHKANRTFLRNLKVRVQLDSLPRPKSSLQKLGCFLKEPLDLITLGVEMFELTKPPKSPFLIILYVIYIVPLFAIITSFIIGGTVGLLSFILACGLFAFLLYWLTLALLGIALVGNLILWGIIGAFVFGLVLYLLLIRLC